MNKITSNILAIMVFSIISSCGHLSTIRTIHDDFEGYTIYRMTENVLAGGMPIYGATIRLNAQCFVSKEGNKSYSVIVRYTGDSWIFIKDGESLMMLIDGAPLNLSGDGSLQHRNTIYGAGVEELAWYEISEENFRKIANAKEVQLKIKGSQYFTERKFSQANFNNFKKFITNYMDK